MTRAYSLPFFRATRAVVCLAVAILVVGNGDVSSDGLRRPSAPTPDPANPETPAAGALFESNGFHLGTAAGPFGWSSAVADFDDDGEPDFTVADRVESVATGGYNYRLMFSVAGHATQSVSFESPVASLTVALQDIDHDQDLDVIITEVPSRIVNAVWLNDGHGQFVESPLRPPRSAWLAEIALSAAPEGPGRSLVVPNRFAAPDLTGSATARLEPGRSATSPTDRAVGPSRASATPCRAPPRPPSSPLA